MGHDRHESSRDNEGNQTPKMFGNRIPKIQFGSRK